MGFVQIKNILLNLGVYVLKVDDEGLGMTNLGSKKLVRVDMVYDLTRLDGNKEPAIRSCTETRENHESVRALTEDA